MVCVDKKGNITQAQHGKYLMVSPGYTFLFGDIDEEIARLAINYRIEMDGFTPKLVAKDGVELPEQPEVVEPPMSLEDQLKALKEESQILQLAMLDLTDMVYKTTKKL